MLHSPVKPKPLCRTLEFIWNWKCFIESNLTSIPLENHSKYNSFCIVKEQELVKFRAKRLPQYSDSELQPRSGLRLYKQGCKFEPVSAAEFRTEDIKFDCIMKGINRFTAKLPLQRQMEVLDSWGRIREMLDSLKRRRVSFPTLKLDDLPMQQADTDPSVNVSSALLDPIDSVETAISGEQYSEDIRLGDYAEIDVNTDVCVYTSDVATRPWVGRVTQLLQGGKFEIAWFSRRRGRGGTFHKLKDREGNPVLSKLDLESVMFWHMSENRTADSFTLSSFWLEAIKVEYEVLDESSA